MRRVLALTLAVCAAAAPSALAQTPAPDPNQPQPPPQPPPRANELPDRITITAVFKTIVFGEPSFISGRFRHLDNPDAEEEPYVNHALTLEEAPHPFAQFQPIGTTATDRDGWYSFKINPGLNSRYRVRSASPAVESVDKIVRVRLKASMRISDRTPRRGQRILITGSVSPEHDGKTVYVECRRPNAKRFRTVGRARLRDDGERRSIYRERLRVGRDCDFRVRLRGDRDHLPNALGKPQQVRVG